MKEVSIKIELLTKQIKHEMKLKQNSETDLS